MKKFVLATLAALLVAGSAPAFAKEDCDAGYKAHLSKMMKKVDTMPAITIADVLRKGLAAYDSCKAGDSFSPKGVWDQLEADGK